MIRVAVGLLRDRAARVLINQRKPGGRHPGRWEFPGGKLEKGETPRDALARELREELGIDVLNARPRMRLRHCYEDLSVELDVWDVSAWRGEVCGREGHRLQWIDVGQLADVDLLEADRPIVTSLRLPSLYAVTPGPSEWSARSVDDWLNAVTRQNPEHRVMIQLRLPGGGDSAFAAFAADLAPHCHARGMGLILNGEPRRTISLARQIDATGVQVPARFLSQLARFRDDTGDLLIGGSCHNAAELAQAASSGVDFAVLGTVNATPSHPGIVPMGWSGFARLTDDANLPVFAIGGVTPDDLETAWSHGAQGVAGISSFWGESTRNEWLQRYSGQQR